MFFQMWQHQTKLETMRQKFCQQVSDKVENVQILHGTWCEIFEKWNGALDWAHQCHKNCLLGTKCNQKINSKWNEFKRLSCQNWKGVHNIEGFWNKHFVSPPKEFSFSIESDNPCTHLISLSTTLLITIPFHHIFCCKLHFLFLASPVTKFDQKAVTCLFWNPVWHIICRLQPLQLFHWPLLTNSCHAQFVHQICQLLCLQETQRPESDFNKLLIWDSVHGKNVHSWCIASHFAPIFTTTKLCPSWNQTEEKAVGEWWKSPLVWVGLSETQSWGRHCSRCTQFVKLTVQMHVCPMLLCDQQFRALAAKPKSYADLLQWCWKNAHCQLVCCHLMQRWHSSQCHAWMTNWCQT